jgi:guanylate kinase
MSRPLVIVLHGPAGVGKDSVIDALRERTGIHRATSTTSRKRRRGERDGAHYYFVPEEEFIRRKDAGAFLEHARVYDDWKGLERSEVEGPLSRGEDLIIRTDVQGARTWRKRLQGAVYVLLVPQDAGAAREELVAALRSRLHGRKTEDAESIERRIQEFDEEMADAPNNDYVVVNREGALAEAVAELERIIEKERANPERPPARLIDG